MEDKPEGVVRVGAIEAGAVVREGHEEGTDARGGLPLVLAKGQQGTITWRLLDRLGMGQTRVRRGRQSLGRERCGKRKNITEHSRRRRNA